MARRFRLPKSVAELAEWYMRYVSPLALIAGFLMDTFVLAKRVDLFITNALLFTYLLVSAAAICLINLIQTGRIGHKWLVKSLPLLPVIAQFAFGGLFSAYLSLYSRSADIALSWIFVLAIAALVLLNERFSHFYARFEVQLPLYFTVLFSFLIFFLPVVFHQIGPFMFVGAGFLSLTLITLFLSLLYRLVPEVVEQNRKHVAIAIGCIFALFNLLYFTNAIPPLPLALKSAGVYHSVERQSDGTYLLKGEPIPWYRELWNHDPVYHRMPGEPVFVWSAIFSPSGLNTSVLHQWQWYDPQKKGWVTQTTVRFPIVGGRDGGFRGYSEKIAGPAGQWRVNVITQYGQLIGRVSFQIADTSAEPSIVEVSR